jgi:predicted dehydrogenase
VDLNEERALELAADVGSVMAGATVEDNGTKYRAAASERRGTPVPHASSLGPVISMCDAVYIGTTPGAHAPLVLEALKAGKHVLLEKPLAATPEDADAIVDAAEAAAGLHIGMDIGMRWNPALRELRRLAVAEKAIGALKSAQLSMHYTMWPREWQIQPWCAARAEGGPLREVGTHCEHNSNTSRNHSSKTVQAPGLLSRQ